MLCKYMRVMFRGCAKTVENGRVRQWSNQQSHEHWRILVVSVEVAVRRVGWLQAMLRDEMNHAQPLAAIFGRFLWKVLEEKGGLCEGANPFAVAFHRDAYSFEGVTGTEELYEALRKDGFQSLFVAQSAERGRFFFKANLHVSSSSSLLDNGPQGVRLANHVKFQCGEIRKFDWCCEILSEAGAPCGSRFQSKKSFEVSPVAEQPARSWTSDIGLLKCHHQLLSMVPLYILNRIDSTETRCRFNVVWSRCRVDAGAFLWAISPPESLQCRLCDDGDTVYTSIDEQCDHSVAVHLPKPSPREFADRFGGEVICCVG